MIGVGLNLTVSRDEFPAELRDTATLPRRDDDRSPLPAATALNRSLDRWVAADREDVLPPGAPATRCAGARSPGTAAAGVADGIEDSGDLVVVAAGGDRVVLGAGEVHLRL